MKNAIFLSAFLFLLLLLACERDDLPVSGEGLSMVVGNQVLLTAEDIDYYDLSTHFIYLKGSTSFLQENMYRDSFSMYANGEKIYAGVILSHVSSWKPEGAVIYMPAIFYADYILPIGFNRFISQSGTETKDLRKDQRIVEALKSHDQLHEGLQCEIRSVLFNSGGKVSLELELINNDSFNYYYPDPEKMGMGLFHYFTNGLHLWNTTRTKSYENHVQHVQPDTWDSWQMDWLSLIRSHEKKTIWIHYTNFDPVSSGSYQLSFRLPGLSHVDKAELVQRNGRIWLGGLDLSKEIQIR